MLVKIENYFDGDCWCARGIGEDIFTQGRTLDELHENVKEAVACHFGDIFESITISALDQGNSISNSSSTSCK